MLDGLQAVLKGLMESCEPMQDVKQWLITCHSDTNCTEMQDLRETVQALTATPKPKKWKAVVRRLCTIWDVQRGINRNDRPFDNLIEDVTDAALQAARKLRTSSAERLATAGSSVAQPAIPDSLQELPIQEPVLPLQESATQGLPDSPEAPVITPKKRGKASAASAVQEPPTAKAKISRPKTKRPAEGDHPASSSGAARPAPGSKDTAERPTTGSSSVAEPAKEPSAQGLQDTPVRAGAKKRCKPGAASSAQEPPAAKAKTSRPKNKRPAERSAPASSDHFGPAPSAPESKERRLSIEMFAVAAVPLADPSCEDPEITAHRPSFLHQMRRTMFQLLEEAKSFRESTWLDDCALEQQLDAFIARLKDLKDIQCSKRALATNKPLYGPICGLMYIWRRVAGCDQNAHYQSYTFCGMVACNSLLLDLTTFLQSTGEVDPGRYPAMSQLVRSCHASALNGQTPVLHGRQSASSSIDTQSYHESPESAQRLLAELGDPTLALTSPFTCGALPNARLFDFPFWYSLSMFASIELGNSRLLELPLLFPPLRDRSHNASPPDTELGDSPLLGAELLEKIKESRRLHSEQEQPAIFASDITEVLQTFLDDGFSVDVKRRWFMKAMKVTKQHQNDDGHITALIETTVEEFTQDLRKRGAGTRQLSKHAMAACALYHRMLIGRNKKPKRSGPTRIGPTLRLMANALGSRGKQYIPQDRCGEMPETLAANRMPAFWVRLHADAERPVEEPQNLQLAVATPPVMCWICGEGFMHNGALFKHTEKHHGDYAEYRKRLFWFAQQEGFKPLLPWVKRHILQAATFHLTYSVPASFSLKYSHPDVFNVAVERAEVACVVCARKDWIESNFSVYLWREATDRKDLTAIQNVDCGSSELLTCDEHLCFGNRNLVDLHLATEAYHRLMPLIPQEHLYASSVIHPQDPSISWLLHTRRVPVVGGSRQCPTSSAGRPARQFPCAGVGDPDETAWICYDCATCLCVDDKLIKMPEYALSNLMWLGRQHPLLQNASLGLRMLLGLARPCFRKLFLGKGRNQNRQSGLTGNHVLVSQACADVGEVLPPTSSQLSNTFVAIFGNSIDDLRKCQLLNVKRDDYKVLVEERRNTNIAFQAIRVDEVAVEELPQDGVPTQILECAVHMPESDRYQASRPGPGSLRDPLDATAAPDDAEDELSETDHEHHNESGSGEASAALPGDQHLNSFETPLGLDPTASPSVVQHLAAFRTQLQIVQDSLRGAEATPKGDDDISAVTAQAAAEEDCHRAVVDLRLAAQKLDKIKFQHRAIDMENTEKALLVPSGKALSMFSPKSWTESFTEFFYGDCLPNSPERPRKITFEQLFPALMNKEELEYALDSDGPKYRAPRKSRFDTPEFAIVFGDTLRRLLLFRGTRLALRRKGFQRDVRVIANATSDQCIAALSASAGRPGDMRNANAEALARDKNIPTELATALRQVLISTKDVPLTDGYRRGLRHEGHNYNVTFGTLAVFATFNFADNYSPVLFQLLDGEDQLLDNIPFHLTDDAPNLPTLEKMHQLIAQSPRAQAKFFLLCDDIADIYFMGMDFSLTSFSLKGPYSISY